MGLPFLRIPNTQRVIMSKWSALHDFCSDPRSVNVPNRTTMKLEGKAGRGPTIGGLRDGGGHGLSPPTSPNTDFRLLDSGNEACSHQRPHESPSYSYRGGISFWRFRECTVLLPKHLR